MMSHSFKLSAFEDCGVCCLLAKDFVKCVYCSEKACHDCYETYLLDQHEDKCMFCNKHWSYEFVQTNLRESFINGRYKDRKKMLMFEREKALLPATQIELAEDEKKEEVLKKQRVLMMRMKTVEKDMKHYMKIYKAKKSSEQEKEEAYALMEEHLEKMRNIRNKIIKIREDAELNAELPKEEKKTQMVVPCSMNECRGFVVSEEKSFACGMCKTQHCKKCRCKKEDEHKCDPNTLETIKLLTSDTKPCPKCHIPIFKIAGCFAKDVDILLYDGTTKKSQDIKIGDVLVGDDGNPRKVLDLCSGEDKLYSVDQNNGVTYTVNSKHQLVMKSNIHKKIREVEKGYKVWFISDKRIKTKLFQDDDRSKAKTDTETFLESVDNDNTIHISIEEYLKNASNKSYACAFHGYKTSKINWSSKDVNIDPYLLGLWLGDGYSNGLSIASNDTEIVSFLLDWCDKNECELVHADAYKFTIKRRGVGNRKAIGYGSSSKDCVGCSKKVCDLCDVQRVRENVKKSQDDKNPLKEMLESYNLINNKHIPEDFLCNDEATRLSVLAGLIDSDGYVDERGKRAVISNTNKHLVEQIELLARSCDFVVNTRVCERKNVEIFGKEAKDYQDIYQINLSGKLSRIPTLIKRKQMIDSIPNKDYHVTSISVSYKETGNYYGWKVDGNTRFILPDMTVVKNCDQMFCTGCHTAFSWKTGQIETGHIHNPHYWEYLQKQGRDVDGVRNMMGINARPNMNQCLTLEDTIMDFSHEYYRMLCVAIMHMRHGTVQERDDMNANKDLRKRYLLKEIDEKGLKMVLYKRERKRKFNAELVQILNMVYETTKDMILLSYTTKFVEYLSNAKGKGTNFSKDLVSNVCPEITNITNYALEQIDKLCDRFNYVKPRYVIAGLEGVRGHSSFIARNGLK